jgi:hypothetical protein
MKIMMLKPQSSINYQQPVRKVPQSKGKRRNMCLCLKTLGEILLELPKNTG